MSLATGTDLVVINAGRERKPVRHTRDCCSLRSQTGRNRRYQLQVSIERIDWVD